MTTWLKVLLFVTGGAFAAGGTAYVTGVLDPWLEPEASVVASLPEREARLPLDAEPAAVEEEIALPEDAEELAEPVEDPAASEEDATEEAVEAEELVIPTFDIVRVEPDGSMVIAGHAAPGAAIEVVTGTRVIATARAGADGDFAAVLDEPLGPGDYQIVLRATTPENVVAMSVETAVVSIPDTPDGQVLALVEEPGSPSRLVTVPEPVAPAEEIAEAPEPAEEQVALDPETSAEPEPSATEPEAPSDTAMAEEPVAPAEIVAEEPEAPVEVVEEEPEAPVEVVEEEPQEPSIAEAPVEPSEMEAAEAPVEAPTAAGPEEGPVEAPVAAPEEAPVAPQLAEGPEGPLEPQAAPVEPQAPEAPVGPQLTERPEAPVGPGGEAAAEPMQPTSDEGERDIAALSDAEPRAHEGAETVIEIRVFVEAVEIDGDTVFVAGFGEAGRFVRVYANDIVLGETRVSEGNRFLIEAKVDLPVGDYIIRADLLGGDGSVVARAAVPFQREPGEAIAAVAPTEPRPVQPQPAQPQPAEPQVAEEEEVPVEVEVGEADISVGEEAVAEAEAEIAMTDQPAERDEAEIASEETPAAEPEVAMEAEPEAAMEGKPEVAMEAETDTPAATQQAETELAAEPEVPAVAESDAPEVVEETVRPAPETEIAEEAGPEQPADQLAAAPVQETLSPALERVDGAVIIRRGDNLWRISRRVYGRGIRYSTIYLANQDQIRNPHLIWPGQVFAVPAETEDGAVADLEALGEQAVDPSEVPGEIIR
jgi:nucleoid-associated protein YgaU